MILEALVCQLLMHIKGSNYTISKYVRTSFIIVRCGAKKIYLTTNFLIIYRLTSLESLRIHKHNMPSWRAMRRQMIGASYLVSLLEHWKTNLKVMEIVEPSKVVNTTSGVKPSHYI